MAKKGEDVKKITRMSQGDMPRNSLEEAMSLAIALRDDFAGKDATPIDLAQSLKRSPSSSAWRFVTGGAVAYGLTSAAYNSSIISLTALGERIVLPTEEGSDRAALMEAALTPAIPKAFYEKYNRNKFPSEVIAKNVLCQLGVPRDRVDEALKIVIDNAKYVGILREVSGNQYIQLTHTTVQRQASAIDSSEQPDQVEPPIANNESGVAGKQTVTPGLSVGELSSKLLTTEVAAKARRVFITHGKNRALLEQLKDIVAFGKFEPVLSVEHETPSKPVPDKVMDDMRSCAAAIIHVAGEHVVAGEDGAPKRLINENVLIEIGAAMALYGRNFILLVERGVTLPSNLQGLYECRYEGERLDGEATMKLLKAFNEFK